MITIKRDIIPALEDIDRDKVGFMSRYKSEYGQKVYSAILRRKFAISGDYGFPVLTQAGCKLLEDDKNYYKE